MWELRKAKDRLIYVILLLGFTGIFSYYYWCIQLTFIPDFEALASVNLAWKNSIFGGISTKGIIVPLCMFFYNKYGYTYTTIRMVYLVVHIILVICTLDVVLRVKRNSVNFLALPVYILFMVLYQYIISPRFGNFQGDWQQYPFNQHVDNVVVCAIGVWLLKEVERSNSRIGRIVEISITVVILFWGLLESGDFLISACIILPLGITLFLRMISSERQKKWVYCIWGICICILSFAIISNFYQPLQILFQSASEASYRGTTSYISIPGLTRNIKFFLGELAGYFNFDMGIVDQTNQSILVCVIRIVLVLFGFGCIYKLIKRQFLEPKKVSIMEGTISWACTLLLFIMLFSSWGNDSHWVRYFNMIVPYFTILICNHIEQFPDWLHVSFLKNKMIFGGVMSLVILVSIPYRGLGGLRETRYDLGIKQLVNVINQEQLHTGYCVANLTAYRITAASEGRNIVNGGSIDDNPWMKDEEYFFYDYVIFYHLESSWTSEQDEQEWVEQYGNPDEIVDVEDGMFVLYIYRDGIML